VATYFRGVGKPWFVTVVILGALILTVASGLYLIPRHGVEGAAQAYFIGSMAPFAGVLVGGLYAFGVRSAQNLLRMVGAPLLTGFGAACVSIWIRSYAGTLQWPGFVLQAAVSFGVCCLCIIGGDWLLGGQESPSGLLVERVATSRKFQAIARRMPLRLAPNAD
jgi:hypothetical protein